MPTDLRETIRNLSPGALNIFKKQLASLSDKDRQRAYQRLSGIPELEDLIGRPPQEDVIAKLPAQPEPQRTLTSKQQQIPLWQKGLQTVSAPFQWISEHITEPFGAYATSPFTPTVAGTEGMGWAERERAEYEQWKEPEFTMPWGGKFRPTKGIVETLPWLALPSAGAVAGKLGTLAKVGGSLGRGAAMAEKIVKPIAAVEALPRKIVGKAVKGIRGKPVPAAEVGIPPIKPPIVGKITSELFPEGFNPKQQSAIETITNAVKQAKPVRAGVEATYKQYRAKQAGAYEATLEKLVGEGKPYKETLAEAEKSLYLGGEIPVGKGTKEGFTAIADKVQEDIGESLFEIIGTAPYKSAFDRINTRQALARLLDPIGAGMPREFELKLLEKTFGSSFVKEILGKRPWQKKVGEWATDILNMPRALLASCDLSGLLRQGGVLTARHPIESLKTVRPMLLSFFNNENAALVDSITRSRPFMNELVDDTLRVPLYMAPIPEKVAVQLAEREEAFMSVLLSKAWNIRGFKIPNPILASNRAYVTGLNDLRARSALNVLNSWKKAGLKYTPDDVSDLNQLVNWASGRGDLPHWLGKGGLANATLFSPRLIMSRLALPTTVLPMVTRSELVRKEAWRTLLSFFGAGAGILTMAKLSGATDRLELDPRSADFGKIIYKNTRLDIWTGYLQYIRFITQLALAERKTTETGRMVKLNRGETAWRFAQTKFSPAVGLITDILKGETYLGEALPPRSTSGVIGQLYERMMPLAIQDLIDGIRQDGVLGGIASSVGLAGVGVITYTDEVARAQDKVAKEKYKMSWDEVGTNFGRAEQLKLEQTSAAIKEAEQERDKRFAAQTPTIMENFRSEGKSIEETYQKMINLASKEFRVKQDGQLFRGKVDEASNYRRTAYGARALRKEYQDIIAYYQQPIKPNAFGKMNPSDVLRQEYYKQLFAVDMYDKFGNYLFDLASKKEQDFVKRFGQKALDYIEEYRSARWVDKPLELRALEEARDLLRPYWQIEDRVWSMYPPEMKAVSDQIKLMERTDPERARQFLKQYPMILRARELIVQYHRQMREGNPAIQAAYRTYYG